MIYMGALKEVLNTKMASTSNFISMYSIMTDII